MTSANLTNETAVLTPDKKEKWWTNVWVVRLTSYVAFFVTWWIITLFAERVPGPVETFGFIFAETTGQNVGGILRGQFFEHVIPTLQRFTIGLLMAIVVGTAVGILIGSSKLMRSLLNDTLLVFLALPAVIWAFLTIMWFGMGPGAPIYTTMLTAFPFVAVNIVQGVEAITPDLHNMSTAFGVSRWRRIRHLIVPAVLGYLFAGIRYAIIIGWNGVLLAEWFGAAEGVGWRARFWYDAYRYHGFVGWIFMFIVFIVLLDRWVLTPVQKRAFRWRDG